MPYRARASMVVLCCLWLSSASMAMATDHHHGKPAASESELTGPHPAKAYPGQDARMLACLSVADDPAAITLWEKDRPEGLLTDGVAETASLTDQDPKAKSIPGFNTLDACTRVANENRALFEDHAYLREGAVTGMDICRRVADDLAADFLWQWLSGNLIPDPMVAAWLAGQDREHKEKQGFGTLLACSHVVAAWHSTSPDPSPESDRGDDGAVVIDFQLEEDERGQIAADPLVRLLSSPGLIPRPSYGGIILRNVRIDGTLPLHNLRPTMPLEFDHVEFAGAASGSEGRHDAISVRSSHFRHPLSISYSTICGDIRIIDTTFSAMMQIVQSRQIDCEHGALDLRFALYGSHFDQSLSIIRSTLGTVDVDSNRIRELLLSRNQIQNHFHATNNDMTTFQIRADAFAPDVLISYNRIKGDFLFRYRLADFIDNKDREFTSIGVTNNNIGGGLVFSNFPAEALPYKLDFRSNRIANGSEICLPEHQWDGMVLLDGSIYDGTLSLGLNPRDESTNIPETLCGSRFIIDPKLAHGEYCPPLGDRGSGGAVAPGERSLILVNLQATTIRTLQWHIPLTCDYRWSGFGLSYELWDAPEREARKHFTTEKEKWREAAFKAWRTTLGGYDPAPLDVMSRYFAERGAYVTSRDIQLEAKRLNYAPDCPPDEQLPNCLMRVIAGQDPDEIVWLKLIASVALAQGDDTAGQREPLVVRLLRAFSLVMLWPGGYGAQPERAILLLIGGVPFFGALYWSYIVWTRFQYGRLVARFMGLRQALPPRDRGREELQAILREFINTLRTKRHSAVAEVAWRQLFPRLERLARGNPGLRADIRALQKLGKGLGRTGVHGFSQFATNQLPTRFTPWRYSIDAMLPVINLHAYSSYYPEWWVMRGITVLQHICGWWWLTVFVASAAVL